MHEDQPIKAALTVRARRMMLIREFWSIVLPLVARAHPRWAGQTASESYWLHTSSGVPGLRYDLWVRQNDAGCGLYIDAGSGKQAWNKAVFDALRANRAEIEDVFGKPLDWWRLDHKQSAVLSSIAVTVGYKSPREQWPEVARKLIEQVLRFEAAIRPHLKAATDAATGAV